MQIANRPGFERCLAVLMICCRLFGESMSVVNTFKQVLNCDFLSFCLNPSRILYLYCLIFSESFRGKSTQWWRTSIRAQKLKFRFPAGLIYVCTPIPAAIDNRSTTHRNVKFETSRTFSLHCVGKGYLLIIYTACFTSLIWSNCLHYTFNILYEEEQCKHSNDL